MCGPGAALRFFSVTCDSRRAMPEVSDGELQPDRGSLHGRLPATLTRSIDHRNPAHMDTVPPDQRSRMMRAIKGKNTAPELAVRRALRRLGVGYRLHVAALPGRPDIVMQGRRCIIEVRGCFWHRHPGCRFAYVPQSRREFWEDKFAKTVARDSRNDAGLQARGWRVLTVWECETSNANVLQQRLSRWLDSKAE